MSTQSVTITTEIDDDRTIVRVANSRSAAVVVESASGERVYLPPEADEDDPTAHRPGESHYEGSDGPRDDSPYEGMSDTPPRGDSPYDGATDGVADSPYEGMSEQSTYGSARARPERMGVTPTETGFRVVHPEPVTDVRVLCDDEARGSQSAKIDR